MIVPRRAGGTGFFGRHGLNAVLLSLLLFQVTALKYLLDLQLISRLVNLVVFGGSIGLAGIVLFHDHHVRRVWTGYLLPALLAGLACSVNFAMAVGSRAGVSNQLGLILVVASMIAVVFFQKRGIVEKERLWKLYFVAMVLIVALGLLEYTLVFTSGYPLRSIDTDGGRYVAGRVSLLYETDLGLLHGRFYGAFPEPGTLAMWTLPALAYGVMRRRFIGVAILAVGFFLTRSLGGVISLLILGGVLLVAAARRTRFAVLLLPLVFVALVWGGFMFTENYAREANENRGVASLTVRVDAVVDMLANFPSLVAEAPFGLQRAASTAELTKNPLVFGTTFAVSNVFIQGGLLAVVGFVILVVQSALFAQSVVVRRNVGGIELVCAASIISLLPFVVQRTTVWESSLFALLFAPSILDYLERPRSRV